MGSAPGWYPDSSGGQRWFDGTNWTPHHVPPPQIPRAETITVTGPNHALHAVITIFTCGLWAPIWIIIAVLDSKKVRIQR